MVAFLSVTRKFDQASAFTFLVVLGYPRLAAALPRSRYVTFGVRVVYADGQGILRDVLSQCTGAAFTISRVATHHLEHDVSGVDAVAVSLEVRGQPVVEPLTASLTDLRGVLDVSSTDLDSD